MWMIGLAGVVAQAVTAAAAEPVYAEVTSVEELLDAVAALDPMAGGTIRVRPGTYRLDAPLDLSERRHVNLLGSGWNTTLAAPPNQDALVLENSHFCVIEGFLIDQEQAAEDTDFDADITDPRTGSGIHFRGVSSSNEVRRCRIQRFGESGVRFSGRADSPMSSNAVRDCHFISNAGFQLWSRHNNDYYFIGNQFGSHGGVPRAGAVLDHSSAGTYSMNYHWGNEVAFILGPGAHYNRINTNRFEESRREGIRIGGEAGDPPNVHNTFVGNTIHTNSQTNPDQYDAVTARDASAIVFSNNQILSWDRDSTRHRRSLVVGPGCHSWVITGNIMRHHNEVGLVMDAPGVHVVSDNIIDEYNQP